MANSEHANRNFNLIICNKEQQINILKEISTATDFISYMEASNLMGIQDDALRKMIEKTKVIAYEHEKATFIPTFQFNENNEVSPIFKDFLNQISNEVKGKKYNHRNLILHSLLGYFSFFHPNEFGGESFIKIRGFEYISKFGKDGVTRVSESFRKKLMSI